MGLGVLEDTHLQHVPGTALLTDVVGQHGILDTSLLEHDKGRNSDVLLVPQPSRSPNDPLNWPLWKKDFMLFLICIDTAVVGAWGPMISPGYVTMSREFGISYNALNGSLGWGIFVIGISCFFTNSMAVVWGRRPIFLLGNLLLFISSLGGYFAHSYTPLRASRLIGCIGLSPFEVLVTTTIADIYFVHQRGVRLAAWGLCASVGFGGGIVISGYIIQDLGWNWTYGICACIFGVWTLVLFFFCPETAYRREALLNTDLGTDDKAAELVHERKSLGDRQPASHERKSLEDKQPQIYTIEQAETATPARQNQDSGLDTNEERNSYWSELRIFHGRACDDPFWKVLSRPLMMLIFPQVLFSFFAYGLTTSWLIVVGSVLAQIFTAPPYNFSISRVGLVAISPLIGAIIGAVTSGPIADRVVMSMSRRNGGIYEPEFRLLLITTSLVVGGMSFFGFGWSISTADPWIGPVIFYGLQYFSVVFMSISVYGYLTDCHRDKAPEAFAAINLRNIYSFGMNYFISSWISTQGPKEVFCIIGGVHVFICLTAIPMYIFGKRCRSWTSRVKIFQTVMRA